jgi:hypothetical protein
MSFIVWGSNSLFPSYYTEIWENKYESQDLLAEHEKQKDKEGETPANGGQQNNVLQSGLYIEEDVYSPDEGKRSFFVDKINQFSVNPITSRKRKSSFYANAGYARSFSSHQSRTSNLTTQNEAIRAQELVQILEGGGLNESENYNTVIKLQDGLTAQELAEAVHSINSLVDYDRNGPNETLTFEFVEPITLIPTRDESCVESQDQSIFENNSNSEDILQSRHPLIREVENSENTPLIPVEIIDTPKEQFLLDDNN